MKLSAHKKVERDCAIIVDRARGLRWKEIAERHGISTRHARDIWRAGLEESVGEFDAVQEVLEVVARYESIIEDLAAIAERSNNEAVKVGALKAKAATIDRKLELMQTVGLLPRNLGVIVKVHLHGDIPDDEAPELLDGVAKSLPPRTSWKDLG